MEEKKGKGFLIIGMIASVISVILGIYLLQKGTNFNGHFTEFYGDFNTYMSESMQALGHILEKTAIIIKYGFSFLLISIGAIMFCFFGYKIATFENEPNVIIKEVEKEKTNELESDKSLYEVSSPEIEKKTELQKSMENESNQLTETKKDSKNIKNQIKPNQILGEWTADNSNLKIIFCQSSEWIIADFYDVHFIFEQENSNFYLKRHNENLWEVEMNGNSLSLTSQINGEKLYFHRIK